MEILDKYPISKAEFILWFTDKYYQYGHNYKTFCKAPFVEQCTSISRFLGYSVELKDMSHEDLVNHVNNILYLYEDVKNSYPDGIEDFFKTISKYKFSERLNAFPEIMKPADICHSIREAVVPLNAKDVFTSVVISLRNAIISVVPEIPKKSEEEYWTEEIIKGKSDEAPF